ncbi:GNAT family N-acetyltransferase [Pasteuria penetrans]|uniref:GNAT family N-acetyltransferase n=1 Tax=Pasteuria penetrans TaxID=86005 RepID=UPI000FA006A6|nr:GNAT family N-acetyltransferase [Pasteuria penetrans]
MRHVVKQRLPLQHLVRISHSHWEKAHKPILAFIHRYGEKRITLATLCWLRHLTPASLKVKGTYMATVFENKNLIGVFASSQHGHHSCIVVHPEFRRQGIGRRLLHSSLQCLDLLHVQVAIDNTPCINLFFGCGLSAYKMTRDDTKKPALHFIGGSKAPPSTFDWTPSIARTHETFLPPRKAR